MNTYAQQKDGWCGPAALQYAMHQQGHEVDQQTLVKETGMTSEGCEPEDLKRVAQKHGMESLIIEGNDFERTLNTLKFYRDNGYSIIIDYLTGNSLDDGHYVVMEKILKNGIDVFDPSNEGKQKTISNEYLKTHWKDIDQNGEIIKKVAILFHA